MEIVFLSFLARRKRKGIKNKIGPYIFQKNSSNPRLSKSMSALLRCMIGLIAILFESSNCQKGYIITIQRRIPKIENNSVLLSKTFSDISSR